MNDRTPAITPGDSVGAGTVMAFLAVASLLDVADYVKAIAVVAAAVVAIYTVSGHADLRIARNINAAVQEAKS